MFNGTALYPLMPSAQVAPVVSEHFIPSQKPDELSNLSLRFISNKNNMFYFEIFKVITNDPLFGKNTRLLVFDSYYKKAKDQDIINE